MSDRNDVMNSRNTTTEPATKMGTGAVLGGAAGGVAGGAAAGALAGGVTGPVGAAVGAVVGAVAGISFGAAGTITVTGMLLAFGRRTQGVPVFSAARPLVAAGVGAACGMAALAFALLYLWMVKPATPPKHLVSYVVPTDPETGDILLVDHRNAQLWIPPGGHVDPGEHRLIFAGIGDGPRARLRRFAR